MTRSTTTEPSGTLTAQLPATMGVTSPPPPATAAVNAKLEPVATSPAVSPAPAPASAPAPAPAPAKEKAVFEPIVINGKPCDLDLLWSILELRREHGSEGERVFVQDVLQKRLNELRVRWSLKGPLDDTKLLNIVAVVPRADMTDSDTMFSCHTDTCHGGDKASVKQKLVADTVKSVVYLDLPTTQSGFGQVLGADDGAGCWLMLEMIRHKVPGTYVFHRGEECGRRGSLWLRKNHEEWLKQFKRCVAFDRKGTADVITHQMGQRMASEEFALHLSTLLSEQNVMYAPSANGAVTDSASYADVIPEITNLSVGYEQAHGSRETLDYDHLQNLLDACVKIDWDKLPTSRDPSAKPVYTGSHTGRTYGTYGTDEDDGAYGYPSWNPNHSAHNSSARGSSGSSDSWRGRFPTGASVPPPPTGRSGALTPSQLRDEVNKNAGKKGKKKGHQAAAPAQASTFYTLQSETIDEVAELSYSEMVDFVASMDVHDAAMLFFAFIEEVEALKAKNAVLRRALS